MYDGNIMDYFPISDSMPSARPNQIAVLREIDKVIRSGKKLIILEGPVGCGKSAIAMTLAKAFGSAHIITPRKSLQDQYFADFSDDIVLMKGRNSYPCVHDASIGYAKQVFKLIETGRVKQPGMNEPNCSNAPCRSDKDVYKFCVDIKGGCPYTKAMEIAQAHDCVIHNMHSFIFQTAFTSKFEKRELLVIDEAHEIQGIIRGFISKKLTVRIPVQPSDRPSVINDVDAWCNFFLQSRFLPVLTNGEKAAKDADANWVSPLDTYVSSVEQLRLQKDYYKDRFSVKPIMNTVAGKEVSTSFEFVPDNLGNSANNMLFSLGEYVVLMSGTIYDKNTFCKNLGIVPEIAHFIRIPSSFPVSNRPIYAKPEYQVDTSFRNWDDNFNEMIDKMSKIMEIFGDAKGLIHAPSYDAAQQIVFALPGNRAITHTSSDSQEKLEGFYASSEPLVFVSPVCQQGVDFKEDRARFQIITRVPYLNTSDEFVKYKVENDFPWYNYEALIVFGQQLGRVNRSESDYGATFLMDTRFNQFILRNSKVIPKWVQNAIIWR